MKSKSAVEWKNLRLQARIDADVGLNDALNVAQRDIRRLRSELASTWTTVARYQPLATSEVTSSGLFNTLLLLIVFSLLLPGITYCTISINSHWSESLL